MMGKILEMGFYRPSNAVRIAPDIWCGSRRIEHFQDEHNRPQNAEMRSKTLSQFSPDEWVSRSENAIPRDSSDLQPLSIEMAVKMKKTCGKNFELQTEQWMSLWEIRDFLIRFPER
jgi:hypothetical protein